MLKYNINVRTIFLISLDLKKEWFENAKGGNLENMKYTYKIIKERGNEEVIKKWRGPYHRTILMEATRLGRQNILKWLVQEFQFDVNEQSSNGSTALHIAAYHNQLECARLLLDLGSQHLKDQLGITPLDVAKEEEMQKLLESHFHIR